MPISKKAVLLNKVERERLESELDHGPAVDKRRDDAVIRALNTPPQPRKAAKARNGKNVGGKRAVPKSKC